MSGKYLISERFSPYPGPRYRDLGKNSGEEFREDVLLPMMSETGKVTLVLDGAMGYGSSFLEEAFGGLVRAGYSEQQILDKFSFVSEEEPELVGEIKEYIQHAGER